MSSNARKRRRVRYDRIFCAAAVLVVLIILIISLFKSCGSNGNDNESSIVPTSSSDEKNNENPSDSTEPSDTTDAGGLSGMSFTTISAMPNEIYAGDLILVNPEHEYSFPAVETENSDLVRVYEKASDSYRYSDYEISLNQKAIDALNSMLDKFQTVKSPTDIMVINGYRTKEEQDYIDDSELPGGHSDQHTGLAFQLGIFPENSSSDTYKPEGEYAWINENCAKYGIILRYPEGKESKTGVEARSYLFRYVGVPHSLYMKENNLCLEEYIDLLKGYTSDSEHLSVTDGTKKYEIYYVPANPAANTEIPVPDSKKYTLSGNNVDGFIVTVED